MNCTDTFVLLYTCRWSNDILARHGDTGTNDVFLMRSYIILVSLSPVRPAKQRLSREIRTSHEVYPMSCTDTFILLYTCRWSNDILARHGDTGTNDVFLMRSYLHNLDIDGATICARHGTLPTLTIYFNAVISTSSLDIMERQFWRAEESQMH